MGKVQHDLTVKVFQAMDFGSSIGTFLSPFASSRCQRSSLDGSIHPPSSFATVFCSWTEARNPARLYSYFRHLTYFRLLFFLFITYHLKLPTHFSQITQPSKPLWMRPIVTKKYSTRAPTRPSPHLLPSYLSSLTRPSPKSNDKLEINPS